jgi:mono/diheme cytochrome c family protein
MPSPGDYRVQAGRVDAGTFTGWRIFHTSCFGCHGVGAVGTDLAPNLVERVKTLTPRDFVTKVLTSYRITSRPDDSRGDDAAASRDALIEQTLQRSRAPAVAVLMPAWELDAQVPPHVLDLWAYLLARADGQLGPGKPELEAPAARARARQAPAAASAVAPGKR